MHSLPVLRLSPWHPQVSRITRFRRAFYQPAMTFLLGLFIALALVQLIVPALAQVSGPLPGSIDLMPTLLLLAQIAAVLVMVVGLWFILGHVKDQKARDAILNIFEKAVAFGINVTANAAKDKTMSVSVGSEVVANGLRYALAQGPEALKRIGFDQKGIARALWARLPNVEGEVTDATFNNIVAAAGGTAPASSTGADMGELAKALLSEISRRKGGSGDAPSASPSATPAVSSAAPPQTNPVPPASPPPQAQAAG